MALCTRFSANFLTSKPSKSARQRTVCAAANAEVSADVAAARAWIAAWRAKQGKPAPASERAAPAVRAQSPLQASTAPDGTLVFTADQLQSVGYDDVKKLVKDS